VKKLLSGLIIAFALVAGNAHAQYAATNCSNIMSASMNGANNQKQAVDSVSSMLAQIQQAATACLTNMMKMFGGGFAGFNFANILAALEAKACQVATADVAEVANQGYTLPGGEGTVRLNGTVTTSIPALNVPGLGPTAVLQPSAPSTGPGGTWSALARMLSF
jgi:hypothetical protein